MQNLALESGNFLFRCLENTLKVLNFFVTENHERQQDFEVMFQININV